MQLWRKTAEESEDGKRAGGEEELLDAYSRAGVGGVVGGGNPARFVSATDVAGSCRPSA